MKKQISILMIAAQLSAGIFSTGAFAQSQPENPPPSAEYTMLQRIYGLQGAKLTRQELNAKAMRIVTEYTQTAKPDGLEERLQTALVDLNIYKTPEQAKAFVAEAVPAQKALDFATPETKARILASEMSRIAQSHPVGLAYSGSACVGIAAAEGLGFFGGIFTILEGKWTMDENPTCSSVVGGPVTITVGGEFGGTQSGPGTLVTTTCTNPGDHPHAGEGVALIIGGVGILIGTVFLLAKVGVNC